MAKPNILITGSEGRIGKILIQKLSKAFNFWCLDKTLVQVNKQSRAVDIGDFKKLAFVFREMQEASGGIDAVIHLAANSQLNAPWKSVLHNNIIGTKNIYECARQCSIRKVIFASTNHVTGCYEKSGTPKNIISISDPVCPDSDYASSKIFGEALAKEYLEIYGIYSICLRIGSVLADDNPTIIPRCMQTWLSHRDLAQLVKKSISARINFGIYYGVSNNDGRFWDIANAEKELGYIPQDNAALQ